MDLQKVHRTALGAAYRSAKILRSYMDKIPPVTKKGAIDLVTRADIESEQIIIETILKQFPDHVILAEESGLNSGTSEYRWIIDPLDGTTNFTHQLGIFATSIAFARNDEIQVGIVLNPSSGELFSAVSGQGATLNGQPITVSEKETVADSLLVTGFPYNLKTIFTPLLTRFSSCLNAAQGVRRLGSAALDLCYVACGRFEGFWEQNLKPWDTAAGILIAREAGAVVTDFSNTPFTVDKSEILATNGKIHTEMLSLLELEETK